MTRIVTLAAGLAAVAVLPAGAAAQELPADVDPSRLRAAPVAAAVGSAAPSATPAIASPVVRVRAGAVRIALACPPGGPACTGTLTLHDLVAARRAGAAPIAIAAGDRRRITVRVRRGTRRFAALVLLGATPIGGLLARP